MKNEDLYKKLIERTEEESKKYSTENAYYFDCGVNFLLPLIKSQREQFVAAMKALLNNQVIFESAYKATINSYDDYVFESLLTETTSSELS